MKQIEELLKKKGELMKKYDDYMVTSLVGNPYHKADGDIFVIIREEIEHISHMIERQMEVNLDDALLTRRLYDVVNKNPEHFLDMMEIKDIEKYIRKIKLSSIKKTTSK